MQEKWLVNTDVTIECLNQREDRQEIDLVRDQVEAELLKVTLNFISFKYKILNLTFVIYVK